jgi:hypothetical protein
MLRKNRILVGILLILVSVAAIGVSKVVAWSCYSQCEGCTLYCEELELNPCCASCDWPGGPGGRLWCCISGLGCRPANR